MRVVTDKSIISKAQSQLIESLVSLSQRKLAVSIGYQGGYYNTKVNWIPSLDLWAYLGNLPGEKSAGVRYWNVFGIGEPRGQVSITCEINPPLQGINRRAAGAFVDNGPGDIYLVHRGLFNARGRLHRNFVEENFQCVWLNVRDGERMSRVIHIGELSLKDFPMRLKEFIIEVRRIKNLYLERKFERKG